MKYFAMLGLLRAHGVLACLFVCLLVRLFGLFGFFVCLVCVFVLEWHPVYFLNRRATACNGRNAPAAYLAARVEG